MPITSHTVLAPGDGDDVFKHEPLPHPITHVRLLEILPVTDERDATIRCRVRCARLTDYDQCYTAISYTWRHDDASCTIDLNGRPLQVKANLHHFLCSYRQQLMQRALPVPTVFLWIDALCLDYSNVRERNSQVQIMPNIYQRAKSVLAWLEPADDAAEVPAGPDGLQRYVQFLGHVRQSLDLPRAFHNDQRLLSKYMPTVHSASAEYLVEWGIMLQLCRHRYWSRLWILQENHFAQDLVFMHRDVFWTWADFRAPFVLLWYLTESNLYPPSASLTLDPSQILHSPAADVIQTRLQFERPASILARTDAFHYGAVATDGPNLLSKKESLSHLLKLHRHRLCSDRRDKIYALIGLTDSPLTVDYDRSNIELFCAVLLSLKASPDLSFASMLAHHLDVSAFQYQQNRKSMIKDVPSHMPDQSAADLIGRSCHTAFSVKSIPARTEISDVLQARLGLQKLNYFRITAQQSIPKMKDWSDFPESKKELPRLHGHQPGANMPIVDGFDLSRTSFRAAIFLNPTSRSRSKAVFGNISTDYVEDGDILVTEEKMHAGIIIRISGLSHTWLTVTGVILFARRVTVETDFPNPLLPASPTSTIRSASLSDFCQHVHPTPLTITGCDDREHFTLRPLNIQMQSSFASSGMSTGRHSRSSSNATTTTMSSTSRRDEKRLTSRSDRIERMMEVLSPLKRRNTK